MSGLAKFVVVNRLDRERANFATALEDLQPHSVATLVPVQLPYGEEKGFRGVIDLVANGRTLRRRYRPRQAGRHPRKHRGRAHNAQGGPRGLVAEADDELMSRFFDEGSLTDEELVAGSGPRSARGAVVPCSVPPAPRTSAPTIARSAGALHAFAGRSAARRHRTAQRRHHHRPGRRSRPDATLHLEDRRRPVRRPHHAVPRRHRHHPHPTATVHNVTRGMPERLGHLLGCCRARRRRT